MFDPFIGSGNKAVVAEKRGLNWVGINFSASYLKMAATRLDAERRSDPASKKPPPGMAGI